MSTARRSISWLLLAMSVSACSGGAASIGPSGSPVPPGSASPTPTAPADPSLSPAGPGGPPTASPPPVSPPAGGLVVTDADDGRTIDLSVGETLTVVLGSTYWTFDPNVDPTVLGATSAPVYQRGDCAPGEGCGTVGEGFKAVAPGTVVIRATRSSCGEALACSPDQAAFDLNVVVH